MALIENGILKDVYEEDIKDGIYTIPYDVKHIGKGAFIAIDNIRYVKMHNNIESIGCSAFNLCRRLEEITIPNKVRILEKSVLDGCIELKVINGLENIEVIENNAMSNCVKLKDIRLGDKLSKIGNEAFYRCMKLKQLELPKSLISVGENIVDNCNELIELSIPKCDIVNSRLGDSLDMLEIIRTDKHSILKHIYGAYNIKKIIVNGEEVGIRYIHNEFYRLIEKIDCSSDKVELYKVRSCSGDIMYLAMYSGAKLMHRDLEEIKRMLKTYIKNKFINGIN